jgi:hypothetical protein
MPASANIFRATRNTMVSASKGKSNVAPGSVRQYSRRSLIVTKTAYQEAALVAGRSFGHDTRVGGSPMRDLPEQSATQLKNIEESSGKRLDDFVKLVRKTDHRKHGQIVSYLKSEHGLTHGNANLIALLVREEIEGGSTSTDQMLAAQYEGNKADLLPIYRRLEDIAGGLGSDVQKVVQKTGVSFRRRKQFALVQAPSSKRIALGLNLPATPAGGRVIETSGMCSHRVDITALSEVDDDVVGWITTSYKNC